MQSVKITDDMLLRAKHKAEAMGELNNSITKGQGNLAGFVGEEIAQLVLGGTLVNTYDYDLVLDNGKTVDVKSKRTTAVPKSYYECSVAAFNVKQQCDYYAFVRVLEGFSYGGFLGVYPKELYFQKARLLKKGDVDPTNNYTVKADCYNMRIYELQDKIE